MKNLIVAICVYLQAKKHDRLVRKLQPMYDFKKDGMGLFFRNWAWEDGDSPDEEFGVISELCLGSLWYHIKNRKKIAKKALGGCLGTI